MKNLSSFTLSLLLGCLASTGFTPSRADTTETTTTQTTTTSTDLGAVNLSSDGFYQVVDPITGRLLGRYDQVSRRVDGRPLETGVVIVDRSNGGLVATVDASGNIIDIGRAPASQTLLVSINSRRQDLNRRIDEALNKGQLSATQASAMRAELEQIAADEDADMRGSGVVNYRRALLLGYGLNSLSEKLLPVTKTVSFEPIISTQFTRVDGRLVMVDAITASKAQLSRRIDDEYAAGRMSSQQVNRRKQDLEKISILESKYRRHGELSNSENRKLSDRLTLLKIAIDDNVANINQKRANIGLRSD
jgi:hypothetical protein